MFLELYGGLVQGVSFLGDSFPRKYFLSSAGLEGLQVPLVGSF